jgi:LmbE family N-acetylglucosaminyl deacetylase
MARIVAIAAHPDDETAFAGGMLARYAGAGDEVVIVSVTRGEGGEAGDVTLNSPDDLGAVREAEMRCAAAALGARDVIFLDFVDPRIEAGAEGKTIDASLAEFSAAIRAVLDQLRPEVVLTHGSNGEYGHPQHVFTLQAVRAALRDLAAATGWRPRELLTWAATPAGQTDEDRLLNRDDPADLVVDVTSWLPAKRAALACHRTQHAMIRRNTKLDDVLQTARPVESFRRWPIDAAPGKPRPRSS